MEQCFSMVETAEAGDIHAVKEEGPAFWGRRRWRQEPPSR